MNIEDVYYLLAIISKIKKLFKKFKATKKQPLQPKQLTAVFTIKIDIEIY